MRTIQGYMKKRKREIAYGITIFFSSYFIALTLWPLRLIYPSMYMALFCVVLSFSLLYHSMRYFLPIFDHYHERAMRVSFEWFLIFHILGFLAYSSPPFDMTLLHYNAEIGFVSLFILLIPNGIGCMGKQVFRKKKLHT